MGSNYIGDYIHLKYENYLSYGTNRSNTAGGVTSISSAYNQQKQLLLNLATNASFSNTVGLKALEKEINEGFLVGQQAISNLANIPGTVENTLAEIILEKIHAKAGGKSIDLDNFNVSSLLGDAAKIAKPRAKTRVLRSQINKTKQEIQTVTGLVQTYAAYGMIPQTVVMEINKLITQINSSLKILESQFSSGSSKVLKGSEYAKTYKNFVNRFNSDLARLALPSNYDYGVIGEYGSLYCLATAANYSNDKINDLLQGTLVDSWGKQLGVVGNERRGTFISNPVISTQMVNRDTFNKSIPNWSVDEINENDTMRYGIRMHGSSNGTVDVRVNFNDGELRGMQIRGSVKNVAGGINNKNIHVLGGAPLISMLGIGLPDFWNHYLNMLVHTEVSGDAYEGIKDIVAARALIGSRGGLQESSSDLANVLIVNDRTGGGGIKFYDYGVIFRKVLNSSGSNSLNITGLPTSLEDVNEAEDLAAGFSYDLAAIRITRIIAALHQYKISASLVNFSEL